MKLRKIYLSGPMTGIKNLNRKNFNDAECTLRYVFQCDVFNPVSLPKNLTYAEYMKLDIKELLKCDVIFMLHGWELSKGATLEHSIAELCGIKIIYQN
jgi:hypothetical protein